MTPNTIADKQAQDCRAAFEANLRRRECHVPTIMSDGLYCDDWANDEWATWQDAWHAAIASAPVDQPVDIDALTPAEKEAFGHCFDPPLNVLPFFTGHLRQAQGLPRADDERESFCTVDVSHDVNQDIIAAIAGGHAYSIEPQPETRMENGEGLE